MSTKVPRVVMLALLTVLLSAATLANADPISFHKIAIVLDPGADDTEARVAEVLRARITKRSPGAVVEITNATPPAGGLPIYLAQTERGGIADRLLAWEKVILPTDGWDTFPEGYVAKSVHNESIVAVGADKRGVLYAAGEVLRRLRYTPDGVFFRPFAVSTAPAYRYRGSSSNQGGTMRQITGARAWTAEELREYTLDYALAGANCFYAHGDMFEFVKSFDLMSEFGCRPNQLSDFPPEWQATERGDWVCPSIPEARQALLAQWDKLFQSLPDYDVLRFFAGDPGGCRCEKCEPWGKTFIYLCEEVAGIWLKYHPETAVMIANQDVTNEGDQAIFDYCNEKSRDWLYAIAYGPGSNAMSDYFRSELRNDLFEYPGSGPINRYLAETLNQLPRWQKIVHYSDITHWISAQYQVQNPDPTIMRVYGRRTFHTRPKAFYRIFQAIMPFSEGDIIYSEGYHDEFHQYMWNRLLWNPNQSMEDVAMDYCSYQFGDDAAPIMFQAMCQLEDNLETPLESNPGIETYYSLVKEAGSKMPANLMAANYRWRLHMQKADLDKYFQLKLKNERDRERRIIQLASNPADPDTAINLALAVAAEPAETGNMPDLRADAGRLGDETNAMFGVRNVGYFSVDKALTSLPWIEQTLQKAAAAESPDQKRMLLALIADYENPGEGGFYDDAGNKDRQPHLVKGESFDAAAMMDPNNRPSQSTLAYSLTDPRGVVFSYTGLDPAASYKLRATLVAPRIPKEVIDAPVKLKLVENIIADGQYIARDVEVPEFTADFFEYDIPQDLTKDGTLDLTFERGAGSLAVGVSELWLIKK
ncbi:MAG: hypothetical protein NTZ09_14670 [Candidatus Hydrogenedentes bacterium]|nr:hypothetical protein [Candidatus Hydrogenedentota bacterium]